MNPYEPLYLAAAERHGVDPRLLMAQGYVESRFRPHAVGPETKYGRAEGIAQFIPATAKSLGITNPYDPEQAIDGQARLMRENLDRYGSAEKAVLAYHGGTDERNWGRKTYNYLDQVMQHYQGGQVKKDLSDDDLLAAFSSPSSSRPAPQQSLSDDDLLKAFSQPVATPTASPTATQGNPSLSPKTSEVVTLSSGVKINPAANREAFGAGVSQGVRNVLQGIDPAAKWLENKLGIGTAGGLFPTAEQASEANRMATERFRQTYANNSNAGAGEFLTGMAVTMPVLGAMGKAVNTVAQPVVNALGQVAPRTAQVLNMLTGGVESNAVRNAAGKVLEPATWGNRLARFAQTIPVGAAQGGTAALLTGQNPVEGAEIGAVLGPAGYLVGQGLGAARDLYRGATGKTMQELPENILERVAGQPLHSIAQRTDEIVPGSMPTLAEATGNPNLALLQRQVSEKNPAPFLERSQANNAARTNHLLKATGTADDVAAAIAARDSQFDNDVARLFQPQQQADATPVLNKIDEILQGSGGKRDAVKNTLNDLRAKIVTGTEKVAPLYDASGNVINQTSRPIIESDPATLYHSVRKHIGDLLDTKNLANPAGRQAARELKQVQNVLDDVLEQASPGFKNYLKNYNQLSKPIDSMNWLQDLRIADAKGNITLERVNNVIKNIQKIQKTSKVHPAQSVSKEQMEILTNIRDDLLRQANLSAGKAAGSNTVQNAVATAKLNAMLPGNAEVLAGKVNPRVVGGLAGAAVGSTFGSPLAGAYVGDLVTQGATKVANNRSAAVMKALENRLLNPSVNPSGVTPLTGAQGGQNLLAHYLNMLRDRAGVPAAITYSGMLAQPAQ